ncbi:MAG: hypothetical protein KGI54_16460 [Pseudomonadota bacterium]|nr:hypothetical protein [Pseudomonadota bacterium]
MEIEAAILALAPEAPLERPTHRSNPLFQRGELSRYALDVLREADEPLSMRDIADKMLARKGHETEGEALREHTRNRLSSVLAVLNAQGRVQKVGAWNRWRWCALKNLTFSRVAS